MLTTDHADELQHGYDAFAAVLAIRLEERRAGSPLAVEAGNGATGEGIPPLDAFRGSGPFGATVAGCSLSAAEALVLLAAIAPEIDESVGRWFGELSGLPGSSALTGELARRLVARSFAGRLAAVDLLHAAAPLRRHGLLRLEPSPDGPLAGRLVPDPDLVAWILGRRPPTPEESADQSVLPLRTVYTLDDVVVPAHVRTQLEAVVARIRHRPQIVDRWGFGSHHDNAGGIVVLLHGPPGTGKTMSAAVIARTVALPAYAVDLSGLVSKYIGETQKALARVFDRAEREGSILVFDEADALFGARTGVQDAHDRYANQDVGYLLQRIERHAGVVILATNLLANIDDAFQRRIDISIEFPEPSVAERLRLWSRVLPDELPIGPLDFAPFAERFTLTGAQIRDAAIEAAYLAADNGQVVTETLLESAVRSQYAKTGRTVPVHSESG
jgi:hypothetical protein